MTGSNGAVTRRASRRRVLRPAYGQLLSLGGLIIVWLVVVPLLPTEMIPSLPRLLSFMWDEIRGVTVAPTSVWTTFGESLIRLTAGLALAAIIGSALGLAMGASRHLDAAFRDFIVIGLSVPTLVWALLTGIWFGFGDIAPFVTVVLAATPFVVMNIAEGVRAVPADLTEMAWVYRSRPLATLRHVAVPSLAPFAFSAFRYALSAGWKALVIAEVFAATSGAGWTIQFWRDARRPQGVFGYAVFFVIFALLLEKVVVQRVSRRVFRWR